MAESQGFPVERLRISTNRQGLIDVEDASVAPHLTWDAGLWLGYARNPLLIYRLEDNARVGPLVESRLGAALVASMGLYDRFEVGVDLPVILYQGRPRNIPDALEPGSSLASLSATGAGDLRLLGKWQLLQQRDHGINLALMPAVTLPSGGARAYFGDVGPVFEPEVLLSWGRDHLRAGMNLGAALRRRSQLFNAIIGSELTGRAGAGYRFQAKDGTGGPPLELDASLSMSVSATRPFQRSNEVHLELRGLAAYDLSSSIQVFGGAGLGLARGWGTPDWRLFVGVRYGGKAPPAPPPAPVKVAVVEPADRDHDGIIDSQDACPDAPETKNGYQDDDGCPDELPPPPPPPDPDRDGDGLVDRLDSCPNEPGPADNHGCPDLDRDGDGLVDRLDNCPDEKGTPENHGCAVKQLVVITRTRIEILEKLYFQLNQAIIDTRSYSLLENVVAVLKAHPEVEHVLVEGHTDDRGPQGFNQKLSEQRAAAVVKFLVKRGVAPERLKAQGFGSTRPVADNATPEGRDKNRRVMFTVLDEDGAEKKDLGPGGGARETTPPEGSKKDLGLDGGVRETTPPEGSKKDLGLDGGVREATPPEGPKKELGPDGGVREATSPEASKKDRGPDGGVREATPPEASKKVQP